MDHSLTSTAFKRHDPMFESSHQTMAEIVFQVRRDERHPERRFLIQIIAVGLFMAHFQSLAAEAV